MKHLDKIQHLLPLGYLYLVVLGIMKEAIFFYQLDINILQYSSIMDILISPVSTLTSSVIAFGTIISFFFLCYHLPAILYKHGHKKWVIKLFELNKTKNGSTEAEIKNYYFYVAIKSLALFLLSMYIGFGVAGGYMTSNEIKKNKLKYRYVLNYSSGSPNQLV